MVNFFFKDVQKYKGIFKKNWLKAYFNLVIRKVRLKMNRQEECRGGAQKL